MALRSSFLRFRRLPPLLGRLLAPLPLFPLEQIFQGVLRQIVSRHPDIFDRLGPHAGSVFLIEMTDLPFYVRLDTSRTAPRITLLRDADMADDIKATISGSFLSHLKMLSGELDGDALFFSRELSISGDTEAVLALRNAVDSLELGIPDFMKGKSHGKKRRTA